MRGIKEERLTESTRIPWQKIYDIILCVRDSALRCRVYPAHKHCHQRGGAQTTLYAKTIYSVCCEVARRRGVTGARLPSDLEASQDVVDPFLNPFCAALNELLIIKQHAARITLSH